MTSISSTSGRVGFLGLLEDLRVFGGMVAASASASLSRSASLLSSISVSCNPRDLLLASDSLYDSSSDDPSSSEKRKEDVKMYQQHETTINLTHPYS